MCKKAQGFLESERVEQAEKVDANKNRIGRAEALKLLAAIKRLVAARGKKIAEFDLAKNRPDDDTLLAHLLGPTGNLRAPTARIGDTLLVGFNEEMYQRHLKSAK
jgi:arsenate reductase-like glutaredoxin family protein